MQELTDVRKTIRRMRLGLVLTAILLAGAWAWLCHSWYVLQRAAAIEALNVEITHHLEANESHVVNDLGRITALMRALSMSHVTGNLLTSGSDADARQALLAVLSPVLEHIAEFRLLDDSGMERLRLIRGGGGEPGFVQPEALVSRASSACFLAAMDMPAGHVFLAPLSTAAQMRANGAPADKTLPLPLLRVAMPMGKGLSGRAAGLMVLFIDGRELYWMHEKSPLPPHAESRRIDAGFVYTASADGVDVLPEAGWSLPAHGLHQQRLIHPATWLPLGFEQQSLTWRFGINLSDHVVGVRLHGREHGAWGMWFIGVVWIGLLMTGVAISRSSAMLADVRQRHLLAEVKGLSQRLMKVHGDECSVLARVLHDEVGQSLAAVQMRLAGLARDCDERGWDVAAQVRKEEAHIRQVMGVLRAQLSLLSPSLLEALGLHDALLALLEESRRQHGLEFEAGIDAAVDGLDGEQALVVYRLLQEALSNIQRHASASRVSLQVRMSSDRMPYARKNSVHLDIRIEDDGRGFDMQGEVTGFGLIGMRERVGLLGGEMHVDSSPGGGTRLHVTMPVHTGDAA